VPPPHGDVFTFEIRHDQKPAAIRRDDVLLPLGQEVQRRGKQRNRLADFTLPAGVSLNPSFTLPTIHPLSVLHLSQLLLMRAESGHCG